SALAAKAATTTVPIVFVTAGDPVRVGLVANLNRPGGNVTGVVFTSSDLTAKQLGLLHELVPKSTVIAALFDPGAPSAEFQMRDAEEAGRTLRDDRSSGRGRAAHRRQCILLQPTSTTRHAGGSPRAARNQHNAQFHRGRPPGELRSEPDRC